ncbi:C-signal-like [Chiloscyllium punctatum]|uniref:C-signal-like n=1 Tax=Chiloscyllium punctatum TaxID=137246 RepID=UPI003B63BBC9
MQSWALSSVLVTGANRGLGLELVHQLARAERPPRYLLAGCRDPQSTRAQDLMNLAKSFSNIKVLKLDVDDFGSIQECAAQAEKILENNGLNLLINNAGASYSGALNEITPESMMNSYRTNVVGPMMLTKVLLPTLQKAACLNDEFKAAVINMSSVMASLELFNDKSGTAYAYRASKTALNMVTKCLANELKPHGIISVSLHPGWVQTDMGGEKAPLTKEESVRGILQVVSKLSAKDNGSFLDWKGQHLPW